MQFLRVMNSTTRMQVAVLGVLERIGMCVSKVLTTSSFKGVAQVFPPPSWALTFIIKTQWLGAQGLHCSETED